MEEKKSRVEKVAELMTKIESAMNNTRGKQTEIDEKQKALREETRPIVVEEGKAEIEELKKEKAEFDEMTLDNLVNASKEIKEIREQNEKEYQDKLMKTLQRKKDIEDKLKSMKKRDMSPENMEKVEKIAKESLEKVNAEMKDFQDKYFEARKKLDDWDKQIEAWSIEIGVKDKLAEKLTVEATEVVDEAKGAPKKRETKGGGDKAEVPKNGETKRREGAPVKSIEDIRNRIAKILGIAPFPGIENENEHAISYQLDDSEIDEIQELKEELKQLKNKRSKNR